MSKELTTKIAVFEDKKIRKIFSNGEYWFSVVDVVGVLSNSDNPRDYWFKMKIRVKEDDAFELSTICRQFKLEATDGKMRETDCDNTERKYGANDGIRTFNQLITNQYKKIIFSIS